jgi:hypothetical protein
MELAQLRARIRDAARKAFVAVQEQHADESFYCFALQSLDDASGVYAAANTEAGYRKCATRYSPQPHPAGERYCRWYWGEWAYTVIGEEHFKGVNRFINSENKNIEEIGRWLRLKATVYASMALALRDLDAEGIFGTGKERKQVTLFCTVDDSFSTDWVEEESARRLNSPSVYQTFASYRKADMTPLHPDFQLLRDEFVRIVEAERAASAGRQGE